MLKSYVIFDSDGTVAQAGSGKFPPPEAVAFTPPLDPAALVQMMLVMRPVSPEVVSTGNDHVIPDCPEGTVVEVSDITTPEVGEIMQIFTAAADGETISVTLPDPGTYRIEVKAPLPYLPSYATVQVE